MARPKFANYKEYMNWRLDRRLETMKHRIEGVRRNYVDKLDLNDPIAKSAEDDRLWLDQFCKGKGLDIACGDFLCGDDEQALGVDGHERQIGTDHYNEGDELTFTEPGKIDFIVTNYLDAFPNPLSVLNEWYRALTFKKGVLAIVCRDAEAATRPLGPMSNGKRQSVYTHVTLSQYLHRAGFANVKVDRTKHGTLRAYAEKNGDPGNNCPKCGQDRSHLV